MKLGQDRCLVGPVRVDGEDMAQGECHLPVNVPDDQRDLVLVGEGSEDDVGLADEREHREDLILRPLFLHLDRAGVGRAVVVVLGHEPPSVDQARFVEGCFDHRGAVAGDAGVCAGLGVEDADRDRVLGDADRRPAAGAGDGPCRCRRSRRHRHPRSRPFRDRLARRRKTSPGPLCRKNWVRRSPSALRRRAYRVTGGPFVRPGRMPA